MEYDIHVENPTPAELHRHKYNILKEEEYEDMELMNTEFEQPHCELNDDHPYSNEQTISFTGLKSHMEGNIYVQTSIPSKIQDHKYEKMMEEEYEDMELMNTEFERPCCELNDDHSYCNERTISFTGLTSHMDV